MEQEKKNDEILKVIIQIAAFTLLYKIGSVTYKWAKHQFQVNPILSSIFAFAVFSLLAFLLIRVLRQKYLAAKEKLEITNGKGEDSVFAGFTKNRQKIFINQSYRRMHAQVVGTTNAGKTESVILPWAIDDIEKSRGFLFIDGKADRQLLNKIYAYVVKSGREKDFRILSLSDHGISSCYNPIFGSSPDQLTEKIINSFKIENEYYRTVQFDTLRTVLEIFKEAGEPANFIKLRQVLSDMRELSKLNEKVKSQSLRSWISDFTAMNKDKRKEMVSGLVSNLGFFASNEVADLFNSSMPSMNVNEAMAENQILYFQLPVLKSPILGKAVAKMVLQDIQGAVSDRHASGKAEHAFFSVYLDDFTEYLTPQFVSLLNKSRSANVGVVFAHQAIGDLEALGPEVKNQILTNSNLKVFMRTNEPDSAEYFSKIVGTRKTQKVTRRQKQNFFGSEVTNDGSIRDTEEFIFHPNLFKSELGLGEAVIVLPHRRGAKSLLIKFTPRHDLPVVPLPRIARAPVEAFEEIPTSDINSIAAQAAMGN